jgi:glycerate kinase
LQRNYNILISPGAFKDVYSPIEACKMIANAIEIVFKDRKDINTHLIPMVDGGEYSNEVLSAKLKCEKIKVQAVINPLGIPVTSHYLLLDNDTVFVSSSQILRLSPEFEKDKNPLNLTSYGLGQLINDAINKRLKKIIIGLGGTNTVDAGIGMAQALGIKFLNKKGIRLYPKKGKYFTGLDLSRVDNVIWDSVPPFYKDISITALCDSKINISQMTVPTNMKISKYFDKDRRAINERLKFSLLKYSRFIGKNLEQQYPQQSDYYKSLEEQEGLGVAGGINLSLFVIFKPILIEGSSFFLEKFGLEEKIIKSDLIITGEGKFDFSSIMGKVPIGVSLLAKKHNKPVLFLCGDIATSFRKYFVYHISKGLPAEVKNTGISTIISCHKFYENKKLPGSYRKEIDLYKKNTPKIFVKALHTYFQNNRRFIL